jgi:hypothetical protein
LMPSKAVKTVIAQLGITTLTRPEEVYQVSLRLGTSYRGTLRQLAGLRQLSDAAATRWAKIPRASVKARCAGSASWARLGEVWLAGPAADGVTLHVTPGDRLVIHAAGELITCPDGIRLIAADDALAEGLLPFGQEVGGPMELEITPALATSCRLRFSGPRRGWEVITAAARSLRRGLNELS